MSLSIVTSMLPGKVLEIAPRGEIDVDTAHEVREAITGALTKDRPNRIELNLRLVSFIDSVGISAMVAGFQTAEVSGVKLVVTKPSRFVHRQLWVTGLLGLFGAPEPYFTEAASAPQTPLPATEAS
ncbi:MAG TPA: STAS domain-containing protein [Micromonosporaceae bacterium]|nr:STAS domain-containing protein [Micromonosporaceae bacterium]